MVSYKILQLNADGSGQVEFTWPDGSTCGQYFVGAPVGNQAAFETFALNLMQMTQARLQADAGGIVDPKLQTLVKNATPVPVALT